MTMLVRDVMSVRLLCVRPDTPVREIARKLVRARIGGVPVVDDEGHVLGIVSESDLQPVREGTRGRPVRTATDVMTRPVITLTEIDTVTQAARVLQRHRIKRAPVMRDGHIVGIVTKGDLLRPYLRTDSEILADIELAFLEDGRRPVSLTITVEGGLVRLEGAASDTRHKALLVRLARSVDGVVDVDDRLRVA